MELMYLLSGDSSGNILNTLRRILFCITAVSVVLEMVFFPSWANLVGCIMMVTAHVIFVFVALNRNRILASPFLFVVMMSMFAYRYIPVPGTLISLRPVSYGMETPVKTFVSETLFFLLFTVIYYITAYGYDKRRGPVGFYKSIGLYKYGSEHSIWLLGIVGLIVRIISYSNNAFDHTSLSDTVQDLIYAPVVLFFPFFFDENPEKPVNFKKPVIWAYLIILSIVGLGSNSRFEIMSPFILIAVFYFIYLVKEDVDLKSILSPKRIIYGLVSILLILGLMQTISDAMLTVRNNKRDYSFSQLVRLTAQNAIDSVGAKQEEVEEKKEAQPYSVKWTEEYIDNFALNRYGNIRFSDEIYFYSKDLSDEDRADIRESFKIRLLCLLPTPVMRLFGLEINKSDYNYSNATYLYYKAGYCDYNYLFTHRVETSYLPDGLSIFGGYYLIIQSLLFLIIFWFIRGLSYYDSSGKFVYSLYGMIFMNTYHHMGMYANGIYGCFGFLFRSMWESMLVFLVVNFVVRLWARFSATFKPHA
ncbi:hypothetical protein [Butyrivibrio sp. MC2021]|uniref:hypothetical protein n=1 Tax=Butyrivibrio sp. MC2021 TaxID=1408306 RepID=UPI00047C1368|nr:hypothetical protein [Butyrivibrio sp. MC2021]